VFALLRRVVLPTLTLVLGALWWYHGFAHAVQENCDSDCTTASDVALWRWAFFAALAVWFILLAVHSERRKRRD
jgi:hypothetical protein